MTGWDDVVGATDEGDRALACAAALVDELVRSGMRHACVSPGSRSTPIALALARRSDLAVHVHLDERSAAFFALGIAKATGAPVASACTSGTAAAEFFPAVVEASWARAPLVLLTADRPPTLRGTGANQTIDQHELYGIYPRLFAETPAPSPSAGATFREIGRRLGEAAIGEPPGPVHANLPFRDRLTPTGVGPVEVGDPGPSPSRTRSPDEPIAPEDLEAAVAAVGEARRGIVLAGAIGHRSGPRDRTDLVRRLGWPTIAEPTSGVRVPGVALASGALLLRDDRWRAAHRPDVVVQLGAAPLSRAARSFAASAERLVVVPDGHLDPAPGLPAARVRSTADLLAGLGAPSGGRAWTDLWNEADGRVRAAVDDLLDGLTEPFGGRIARDVAAVADGTLVAASSMPIRDLDAYAVPQNDLRVLGNRGASGIDGFVSTALGVAAASPGRATFALAGDLSFLDDLGALAWCGRRDDLDLVLVVVNNDGGAIFSFLDQAALPEHERLFTTPHALDLGALCAALGVSHRAVDVADEVGPAVAEAARTGPGVRVVEVLENRARSVVHHHEVVDVISASLS